MFHENKAGLDKGVHDLVETEEESGVFHQLKGWHVFLREKMELSWLIWGNFKKNKILKFFKNMEVSG